MRNAPFDDVRVRHALQMALDLETINATYYGGFADWKDARWNGQFGYYTPFDEWPAELKQYYTYDPEGAEKLLDESGYPRGADGDHPLRWSNGFRFAVEYSHRDVIDLGYTEITSSYWADIGVDVTTRILDTGTWVGARADHTYEMITGDMAMTGSITTTAHRHDNLHVREYLACSEPCGIDTSVLDAAADAFAAATTVAELLSGPFIFRDRGSQGVQLERVGAAQSGLGSSGSAVSGEPAVGQRIQWRVLAGRYAVSNHPGSAMD